MHRLLFEHLPADLKRNSKRYKLQTGDVLFSERSSADAVYFIETGCVRMVVHPSDGKQLVLFRARDGESFAEEHIVSDNCGYTAIADKETSLLSVSAELLREFMLSDAAAMRSYLTTVGFRMQQLRKNFERLALPSASAKVLHLLTSLSEGSEPLDLTGRIKTFASDLNLTHETMYRTLKTLEERGDIERQNGWVRVL
ncbi:MAG: Crp/Fnr family transcriptional regulator [Aureliella sp.]